jgi:hypothetical protein
MTDFPRGGSGPSQPVSKAANVALVIISVVVIAGTLAILRWSLG